MKIKEAIKAKKVKISDTWFNGELYELHIILDGPKEIVTESISKFCLDGNKVEDVVLTEIHLSFDAEDLGLISADNLTETLIGPAVESPKSISLVDFNHVELDEETINGLVEIVKGGINDGRNHKETH